MSKLKELRERVEGACGVVLSHYATKPVRKVRSVNQPRDVDADMKPRGLWFSVDNPNDDSPTWASWCEAENYPIGKLHHIVTLASDARLRRISCVRDLDAFHEEFHAPIYPGGPHGYINWRRVADRYQGIIIAPYLWDRRFCRDARWYYSWDVASGCVWDAAAVASITLTALDHRESSNG
jgi:hypothetical protein